MATKQQKKRPAKARTEWRVRRIIGIILAAVLFCGIIYETYALNQNPIRTETALEETMLEKARATAFMIRDEQSIVTELTDYAVPFLQDGERVESNGAIAAEFSDAGSAQRYAELMQLKREYDRYAALASGAEYSSMKVGSLMQKASDSVCAFLDAVDAGAIAAASDYESDYLDRETALEIAVGENIDFSGKLSELSKKIRAQESSVGSYQTLTTGIKSGGYFYSDTDGFEDVVSYTDVNSLTVSRLEEILESSPVSAAGGKIIRSYAWYIAAVVDSKTAEKLSGVKGKIRIRFPQAGVDDVHATIYSMRVDAGGKCAVVFRCIETGDQLLRLRKEEIDIVFGETTGLRIPSKAVRVLSVDGEQVKGVYVLRGNVVTFRRLDTVYTGEMFLLSSSNANSGYVKLYDEIITEGKDLHDGAVVYH